MTQANKQSPTGRFVDKSTSSPNIQNINPKTSECRFIRDAFLKSQNSSKEE